MAELWSLRKPLGDCTSWTVRSPVMVSKYSTFGWRRGEKSSSCCCRRGYWRRINKISSNLKLKLPLNSKFKGQIFTLFSTRHRELIPSCILVCNGLINLLKNRTSTPTDREFNILFIPPFWKMFPWGPCSKKRRKCFWLPIF